MNKNVILAFVLFSLGSVTLFAFFTKNKSTEQTQPNAEKINLALRQTAHFLLKQAGDTTSRIPPIKQPQDNIFFVQIENNFNYDSLPGFLNQSFAAHGIDRKFDVSVWDCGFKELILGFSSLDILRNNSIPCVGRDKARGCYNFTVTFTDVTESTQSFPYLNTLILPAFLSIIIVFAYFHYKNKEKSQIIEAKQSNETHVINIGNSIFNTQNLSLSTNDISQTLTYREAKLLQLFCLHKNELLERDFILKEVWEDEGILVGRSLDVFVSRLRKLLKNDSAIKITSVHGRGYKFETEK